MTFSMDGIESSGARSRAVLEHVSEVIVLFEADATVRDVIIGSPGAFGWEAADLLGRPGWELIHPDDLRRVRTMWASLLGEPGGTRQQVEFRVLRSDGRWAWAEETLTNALDDPAIRAVIANCRDITDIRRAERALRRSERLNRRIVEAASDALAVLDAAGHIVFANPRFGEMTGRNSEHLVGVEFDTLGLPDAVSAPVAAAIRCDIAGEARWLRVSKRALLGTDDEPARTLVSIADDTEAVRLQQRVLQSERLQLLGRFASGVAHDFNNVLSAVRGNAELVVEALPPGSLAHADARAIVHGADRAASLVQQLLDFARGQDLQPKLVDLNEVAADAVEFCEPLLSAKAEVILRRGCPVMVYVDPQQMRRCIANLILNARDALNGDGTITVTVEAMVSTTGDTSHDIAVVRVEDDGCGMSAEQMGLAFEPFFTTKATGTGLGLDAVYRLVTGSGGTIDVSSHPDVGTAFSLRLPSQRSDDDASTGRGR